jgi:hypothetical protein
VGFIASRIWATNQDSKTSPFQIPIAQRIQLTATIQTAPLKNSSLIFGVMRLLRAEINRRSLLNDPHDPRKNLMIRGKQFVSDKLILRAAPLEVP